MNTSACGAGRTAVEAGDGGPQVRDVVDHAVVQPAAPDEVRVGQVRDDVPGSGVLAELLHGGQPRRVGPASAGRQDATGDLAQGDAPSARAGRGVAQGDLVAVLEERALTPAPR